MAGAEAAVTALVERQPPAAPGPDAEPVFCRCRAKIGVVDGAWLFSVHKGRLITARLPASIQCDQCGRRTLLLDGNTHID